jgi:hypothetical protein
VVRTDMAPRVWLLCSRCCQKSTGLERYNNAEIGAGLVWLAKSKFGTENNLSIFGVVKRPQTDKCDWYCKHRPHRFR